MRLSPSGNAAGLGPALGWLAGALASGGALWSWPHLGSLLLGLLLTTAAWGRLWALVGELAAPARLSPAIGHAEQATPILPYTAAGSLSAHWTAALSRGRARLRAVARLRGGLWVEATVLAAVLLVAAFLWGGTAPLVVGIGLVLLLLRRLVHGRPLALALLRTLGGLAWPWWLGHTAWAPLTGASLLLSILWGLAYAGWSELVPAVQADPLDRPRVLPVEANPRALWWTDSAQVAVLVYFLLAGRLVVGAICALLLLGQVLVQAALVRNGRWGDVARHTWPQAALGALLSGLVLGGSI
jgi:hypothetical protein